jgi:hypothetical protein
MFTRNSIIALALAGLSAGALAQESNNGKTDLFGRPYVNQTAAQVYYEADPFAPLPQFEQLRRADRNAVAEAAHAQAAQVSTAAGKTDIFGRPQLNETANEVYFDADPFDPLPQLQSMYQAQIASPAPQVAAK